MVDVVAVHTVEMSETLIRDTSTGTDECYVAVHGAATTGAVDHDESGTLYVTNRKLVFVGESITDAPWSEIAKLSTHNCGVSQ